MGICVRVKLLGLGGWMDKGQATGSLFTLLDRREILRDAVFLWRTPLEVALLIDEMTFFSWA